MTGSLDHFAEWKKINDEGEEGIVSLDTMIRGTCEPAKLLDLVENFVLFNECPQGLVKLLAKNHQYLGVNRAIAAVTRLIARERQPSPPTPLPRGEGEIRKGGWRGGIKLRTLSPALSQRERGQRQLRTLPPAPLPKRGGVRPDSIEVVIGLPGWLIARAN